MDPASGHRLQSDLPCAESQLKLMIHSRGEIGSQGYRDQHEKLFHKECVGCGSNDSLNLRWRPGTYAQDLLWRWHRRDLGTPAVRTAEVR